MLCLCAGVPFELVKHHNPCNPLLVGGLGQGEDKLGLMKLRVKKHRWCPKILKARDPLVFSIGWRRFQSLPVYASESYTGRCRFWGSSKYCLQLLLHLRELQLSFLPDTSLLESGLGAAHWDHPIRLEHDVSV